MWRKWLGAGLLSLCFTAQAEPIVEFTSSEKSLQIELFTSQGCSSCPPAERWLNQWKDHPELWTSYFPMAFHVDYWDQLGWKDPYANGEFSWRQRTYKIEGLSQSVYTPGLMLNGKEWRGWFRRHPLPALERRDGQLAASLEQKSASVVYQTDSNNDQQLVLNSAILGVGLSTYVRRGENARKELKQDFVVLDYNKTLSRNGQWQIALEKPNIDAPRYAMVFWVTDVDSQKPKQITGGWLTEAVFADD